MPTTCRADTDHSIMVDDDVAGLPVIVWPQVDGGVPRPPSHRPWFVRRRLKTVIRGQKRLPPRLSTRLTISLSELAFFVEL